MANLRNERQQHAKYNNENVRLGHCLLSKWCVQVAMNDRLFLRVGGLCHRVHCHIPSKVSQCVGGLATGMNLQECAARETQHPSSGPGQAFVPTKRAASEHVYDGPCCEGSCGSGQAKEGQVGAGRTLRQALLEQD